MVSAEPSAGVAMVNPRAVAVSEFPDVVHERLDCRMRALYEVAVRGSAAQGLEPEPSGACVEVKHPCIDHVRPENREHGFPDARQRGARAIASRHLQDEPALLTGDDPHIEAILDGFGTTVQVLPFVIFLVDAGIRRIELILLQRLPEMFRCPT